MKHTFTFSCLLVLLFLSHFTTFAQPAVQTIVHETQSQQQSIVQFDQSPLSGGTVAVQWTLKIGGVTIAGAITSVVAGLPSGRVLVNFNLAGLAGHIASEPYLKPGEVLTFSFSNAGNTLKNGAGTQNAIPFTNVASTNNWVGDCSDLGFFQQGNFSAPRFCSPVVMDFYQYQYYLSLRVRNSSVFAAPGARLAHEVTWGDGSPLLAQTAYQSDNVGTASSTFITNAGFGPAVIMTSRPTKFFPATLPGTGGSCHWNTTVTPALGFGLYTPCPGALSVQTAFATWDTDNKNTGTLNLPRLVPGSDKVCLGNNVNMMFTDNTILNCQPEPVSSLTPNTQQRFIKIVYGSTIWAGPSNIPDIRVTLPATLGGGTFPVTNNNATGTLISPGGFFATAGAADGNGAILVPAGVAIASTGTQYMGTITTTATNFQAVGQRLYVKLLYWDFCNPYNGIDDTGAEFVENFVEIVTKPVPLTTAGLSLCFNAGTPVNFTSLSGVGGRTAVNWYKDFASIATATKMTNSSGPISLTFSSSDYTVGNGAIGAPFTTNNVNGKYYSVWATQVIGATNSCESDPVEIVIFQQPRIDIGGDIPGTPSGLTSVCNGPPGTAVIYTTTAPNIKTIAPSTATNSAIVNLPTENLWSIGFGAGVSFSPTTGNATTVTYNIAAQPSPSTINNVSVRRRYTTSTNIPIVSPVLAPLTLPTYNINPQSCQNTNVDLAVTVFGQTLGGTVTSNQTICNGSAFANLNLAGQRGAVVRWERTFNAGVPVIIPATAGLTSFSEIPASGFGTYTYYAVVQNASGGPCVAVNSVAATIIVNPVPPQPTISQTGASTGLTICADGIQQTVLQSSDVGTLAASYQWYRNAVAVGGATSSIITLNTVVQSGNYTVQVFGVAPSNCPSPISNPTTVTIRPLPTAPNPTGGGAVCLLNPAPDIVWTGLTGTAGFTISYTITKNPGAVVTPVGPLAEPTTTFTILSPNPVGILGDTFDYKITALTDINGCSASVASLAALTSAQVSIGGTPPVLDVPPSLTPGSMCEGSAIDPQVTFSLDPPSTAPGSYTLVYKIDGGSNQTKNFTVNITGDPNTAITFSEAALNVVGVHSVDLVSIQTPAGCLSNIPTALSFTVNPLPVLLTPQTKTICSGAAVNYQILLTPANIPAGTVFNWPVPVMSDASAQGSAGLAVSADPAGTLHIIDVLTNITGANITATYTITPTSALGCLGIARTVVITVRPEPNLVIGQTKTICGGATVNYQIQLTPALTPAGTLFNWSAPVMSDASVQGTVGIMPMATNPSINDVLTNTTGSPITATYSVTPTSGAGCVGVARDVVITVNPTPVLVSGQTKTICSGASVNYEILLTPLNLPAGTLFNWPDPDAAGPATARGNVPMGVAGTIHISDILTNTTGSNTTVTYTITPTSGVPCGGSAKTVVVTVQPAPKLVTPQTKTICSGQSVNYEILLNPLNLPAGTFFDWPDPDGGGPATPRIGVAMGIAGTKHINDVLTNLGLVPITVTYQITPTSGAGCVGAMQNVVITINPLPLANPVVGNASVCTGSSIILYQLDPLLNPTSTYTWNIVGAPPAAVQVFGGGGTNTSNFFSLLKFPAATGTVQIDVVEKLNGCSGPINSLSVNVNAAPAPNTITGALQVCANQTGVIYKITTPNATSTYNWTVIGGTIIGSAITIGSATIAVNWGNLTVPQPSVSVTETNFYGCGGSPVSVNVFLNDNPVMVSPTSATICSGFAPSSQLTFAALLGGAPPVNPITFNWKAVTIPPNVTGIIATQTGVGDLVMPLTNVSGIPGTVVFEVTPVENDLPNPPNCTSTPQTVQITVNPEPTIAPFQVKTICSGDLVNYKILLNPTGFPPTTKFSWPIPSMSTGAQGTASPVGGVLQSNAIHISDNMINTTGATITATYSISAIDGLCNSSVPVDVVISVEPAPVMTSTNAETICSGTTPILAFASNVASNYAWKVTNVIGILTGVSIGQTGSGNLSLKYTGPAVIKNTSISSASVIFSVTPTSSTGTGCVGAPQTVTLAIDAEPLMTSSPTVTICSGQSPVLTFASSVSAVYNWTVTSILGTVTGVLNGQTGAGDLSNTFFGASAIKNVSGAVATVTFSVIPVSTFGICSGAPPQTVSLTVNPEPVMTSLNNTTICGGATPTLVFSANVASTFSWSVTSISGTVSNVLLGQTGNGDLSSIFTGGSAIVNTSGVLATVTFDVVPTSSTGTGCFGSSQSVTLNVNPQPQMTSPNVDAFCSGDAPTLTFTSDVASNYNWKVTNILGTLSGVVVGQSGSGDLSLTYTGVTAIRNTTVSSGKVTFDVTPTSSTGSGCVGSAQQVTLTIRPQPVMTSPTNPLPFCSGDAPPLTFSASVPSTFNWTVTGITGALTGVTNGQSGSGNLALTFTGASAIKNTSGALGTVTFNVTPTSSSGLPCVGAAQSVTLSINTEPVMNSLPTTAICSGKTPTLVFTSTIASTYSWKVSAITGTVTGVALLQTGSGDLSSTFAGGLAIKNTSVGVATVQFEVTPTSATGSGCVGSFQLVTLTVNPEPIMNSITNPQVCSGQAPTSFTFSSTIPATYSWSVTNITGTLSGVSLLQSGTGDLSATFTGASAIRNISASLGIVKFNVIPTTAGGCSGATQVVTLTINPEPTGSDFTQPGCINGIPLTHNIQTQISNVASIFTYTVSTNNVGVPAGPNRGVATNALITDTYNNVTGIAAQITYLITPVSSSNSCAGSQFKYIVNVSPVPTGNGLPGPADLCSRSPININPQSFITNGVISTFGWSAIYDFGLSGGTGLGSGNITDVLTNITSGVLNATYTVTPSAGGCVGTAFSIIQKINPEPVMTPALTTPFTICSTNAVSSNPTGITLSVSNSLSVTYNVVLKSIDSGLTRIPTTGAGLPASAINLDKFGNTTSAQLKVIYTITPKSNGPANCFGLPIDVTVLVNPEPILFSSGVPQVCSTNASNPPNPINVVLGTNGTSAPVGSSGYKVLSIQYSNGGPFGAALPTSFIIVSATSVGATGDLNLIKLDKYKNTSALSVTVRYSIQATSAAGCISVPLNYDVIVNPEPILVPGAAAVCSGVNSGVVLSTAIGSAAITQYNLKQVLFDPLKVTPSGANAGLGSYALSNFLANDQFTNTTSSPQMVTYTIAPVAAGCVGPDQTVILTVNPAPALLNLDRTVCATEVSSITLGTTGTSASALNYNIISVTIDPSLTQTAGNLGARVGVGIAEISIDKFQNLSNGVLLVTYKVEPVSVAGCKGPQRDIILSVEPAVTMIAPGNASICSDSQNAPTSTNILLNSNTVPSAGFITFDYTAVSTPLGAVTGFFPAQANLPRLSVIADKLVNNTNNVALVTYTITPKAVGAKGGIGCVALTSTVVTISVEPKPRLSITPATQVVCEGTPTTMVLSSTTVPGAGTIQFTKISEVPTGGMIRTSPIKVTYLNNEQIGDVWDNPTLLAQAVTYIFRSQIVGGLGCVSDDITVVLTVNPNPTIVASPQAAICSTDFVNITLTPDVANTVATFTVSAPSVITGASSGAGNLIFQTLFYNSATPTIANSNGSVVVNYAVTPKVNGCTGASIVVPITVNPKPKILAIPSTYKICHGAPLNIPLASNVIGANYTWTVDNPSGLPGIIEQTTPGSASVSQILNNTTGVQASLTYTIKAFGPGVNPNDCEGDQKIVIVTVAPQISASFQNLPSFICKGTSEFLIIEINGQAPFSFVYNDGASDIVVANAGNFKVIQVTPTATTTYTIKSVKDGFNCPATISGQSVTVTVGDTDAAFSIVGPDRSCSPFQVNFQHNQVAGTEYTWQWQDGSEDSTYLATTTVANKIVKHTFTNLSPNRNQEYKVTLRTLLPTPFTGCQKFTSKKVTINSIIITNIIPDKTVICSGETVRFANQSLGVTSHKWFWRNTGTTSQNESKTTPQASYVLTNTGLLNPQPIQVVYQANNTGNCPAPDVVIDLLVYKGVTASFNEGTVPPFNSGSSTVTFTNTSTPLDFTKFRYDWVFGIGGDATPSTFTQSTSGSVPVIYTSPGIKEIILTITNIDAETASLSCNARFSKTITIILPPLQASFDVDPAESCFPSSIKLLNVIGTGFVHEWKILNKTTGASSVSSVADPKEFQITQPGSFTISYKTSIPATGQVAFAPNKDVAIYDLPVASFDLRPDPVFVPDTEMSTFNYTQGATSYDWDFGDGGVSHELEPKYTYKVEGKYSVTLIAKNDHGKGIVCTDTLAKSVTARQGGQAKIPNAFTPNPNGPSPDGKGANGTFNDVFLPIVRGIAADADAYNLQIYDRWGNLIFESTNSTHGWDGYNKDGVLMPAGVYVYQLTLRFSDTQRTTQIGDVTMIR